MQIVVYKIDDPFRTAKLVTPAEARNEHGQAYDSIVDGTHQTFRGVHAGVFRAQLKKLMMEIGE